MAIDMAPLPPSVRNAVLAINFGEQIERFHYAYKASLEAFGRRRGDIETSIRAQLGIGPDDPWPMPDDMDPDDPLQALYDQAADEQLLTFQGSAIINEAFIIVLVHAWEKVCNRIAKTERFDPALSYRLIDGNDCVEFADDIENARLAVNCLKHGSGRSSRTLFHRRPDYFPRSESAEKASEHTLVIKADLVERLFEAMRCLARSRFRVM